MGGSIPPIPPGVGAYDGLAFDYLSELCIPIASIDSRIRMRSAAAGDLIIPRTTTSFADRAFASAGPRAWKSLPSDIKSAGSISSFKRTLKTHLFTECYKQ